MCIYNHHGQPTTRIQNSTTIPASPFPPSLPLPSISLPFHHRFLLICIASFIVIIMD